MPIASPRQYAVIVCQDLWLTFIVFPAERSTRYAVFSFLIALLPRPRFVENLSRGRHVFSQRHVAALPAPARPCNNEEFPRRLVDSDHIVKRASMTTKTAF